MFSICVRRKQAIDLYEQLSGNVVDGNTIPGNEIFYYFKGEYMLWKNYLDSAKYYFYKEQYYGKDIHNQFSSACGLEKLYSKLGIADSIIKYSKLSSELGIKMEESQDTDLLYELMSKHNSKCYDHNIEKKKSKFIIIEIITLILSIVVLICLYKYWKKRIIEKDLDIIGVKEENEHKIAKMNIQIEKLNEKYEKADIRLKMLESNEDEALSQIFASEAYQHILNALNEKRYKNKPVIKKEIIPKEEDVEILDFTKTISIPKKEVIEILDFTRTIDITDTKDIIKSSETAKKKVKREKTTWTMVIVVSSVILIILLVVLINWSLENKKTDDMLSDVYDAAEVKEIKETTTTLPAEEKNTTEKLKTTSLYDKYESMNMLEVNFDNLKSINPDTVGWIKVPGTKINYPFVHTKDNEYYLKHDVYGNSSAAGSIYMPAEVEGFEEKDIHQIIIGHHMRNGSMFSDLVKYKDKSFWEATPYIYLYYPDRTEKWLIYSPYHTLWRQTRLLQ